MKGVGCVLLLPSCFDIWGLLHGRTAMLDGSFQSKSSWLQFGFCGVLCDWPAMGLFIWIGWGLGSFGRWCHGGLPILTAETMSGVVAGIVLYCIVLYCIVLYCIVLYCIVLYCIVLYCIVLMLFLTDHSRHDKKFWTILVGLFHPGSEC